MSQLDRVIGGSISANSATPSRPGFGTGLGMAYHTKNTDLVRTYTDANGLLSDGFVTADVAYKMAAAYFSQNPRPKQFKLGRMTTAVQDKKKLTIRTAVAGQVISVDITNASGVKTTITRTVPGSSTLAAEATAVAALIAAISGVASATAASADITVTITTAGAVWFYANCKNLDVQDIANDALVDADIAAISLVDADFYGIALSVKSKANIDKVASYAETNKKLFVAHTADSVEAQTGNSLIGTALKAASYTHTFPFYSRQTAACPDAGLLGKMLAKDPGSATFAFKTLAGVPVDGLSDTEITALEACGMNYYITISGRNVVRKDGTVASGEKADIILGTDWMHAQIKGGIMDFLADSDKVDYDDGGISAVCAIILGVLKQGVRARFLDPGNGDDVAAPFVIRPKISDIPVADRQGRHLPSVQFGGRLRGAIHAVDYVGVLSV
jgi:hypothetical protein